jgi:acetolactate synthase regulatory subunit
LRTVLNEVTRRGFAIDDLSAETVADNEQPTVAVTMHVHGRQPVSELATVLSELELVHAVIARDHRDADE